MFLKSVCVTVLCGKHQKFLSVLLSEAVSLPLCSDFHNTLQNSILWGFYSAAPSGKSSAVIHLCCSQGFQQPEDLCVVLPCVMQAPS